MPVVSILVGLILIAIGATGYVATEMASVTALIPAFLGIVFVICGFLARNEAMLKHAMHAAALVALIGFGATVTAIPTAIELMQGAEAEGHKGTIAYCKAATAVVCIVFVVLAINSFIQARKAKAAAA